MANESYYYSINDLPGNGTQTTFEVSFAGGYISKSHISARLFRDVDGSFSDVLFDWVNDFTVRVATPVPLGYTLRMYRKTPVDKPLVDYTDGALLNEINLDTANRQAIFAAAEAVDAFGTAPGNDALRDATAALAYARARANHTGTQAISTIVGLTDALAGKSSVKDVSVLDYGAKGDGVTDDTAAIQAAIDANQGGKARIVFPARTYMVRAKGATSWAGGSDMLVALFLRSGIELVGHKGTVIKMAPNVSSNAAPKGMTMLFTNQQLSDVTIRGIVFDMNGQNNKHGHSLANHAHIHVTGNGALINHVLIEDCEFNNTAGVTCICMGQVGTAPGNIGADLGKDWVIFNCKFRNNGLDTVDHSSIFAWAEYVLIIGCLFSSPLYDPVLGNGNCCGVELHGANQKVFGCTWEGGAYQAIWVSENTTREAQDIVIDGNTFRDIGAFGIAFFGQEPTTILKPVRGCKITNNQFTFNNIKYPGVDIKGAVTIASPYAQIEWEVYGNSFRAAAGMLTATAGVLVAGGRAGEKHDKGLIERNTSYGCTYCVAIFTYAAGGLGTISIVNNVAYDCNGAGVFPNGAGFVVNGGSAVIDDLTIIGNRTFDLRGSQGSTFWGLRVSGNISRLEERFNRAFGVVVASADYTGLSVGFRYGYNVVPAPTGGTVIDVEGRAAINLIRVALVQAGLLPG